MRSSVADKLLSVLYFQSTLFSMFFRLLNMYCTFLKSSPLLSALEIMVLKDCAGNIVSL